MAAGTRLRRYLSAPDSRHPEYPAAFVWSALVVCGCSLLDAKENPVTSSRNRDRVYSAQHQSKPVPSPRALKRQSELKFLSTQWLKLNGRVPGFALFCQDAGMPIGTRTSRQYGVESLPTFSNLLQRMEATSSSGEHWASDKFRSRVSVTKSR